MLAALRYGIKKTRAASNTDRSFEMFLSRSREPREQDAQRKEGLGVGRLGASVETNCKPTEQGMAGVDRMSCCLRNSAPRCKSFPESSDRNLFMLVSIVIYKGTRSWYAAVITRSKPERLGVE